MIRSRRRHITVDPHTNPLEYVRIFIRSHFDSSLVAAEIAHRSMPSAMYSEAQARSWESADMRIKEWWLVPPQQKRAVPADSTIDHFVIKVARMEWQDKAEWILAHANAWPLLVKLVLEKVHDKQCAARRTKKKARSEICIRPRYGFVPQSELEMVYPFAIALPDGPLS